MHPLAHSISAATKRLGFGSRQTTYHEINAGRLRSYTVGRRRFISEDALLAYIRAREAETQESAA